MLVFALSAFLLPFVVRTLALSTPAQAFGEFGHPEARDRAYRNLTETTKLRLKELLKSRCQGNAGQHRHTRGGS